MVEKKPNSRTLLSNERTFLSWLRTAVSLMAFGFVVSKFDLFLNLHRVHRHAAFNETFLGLAWVGSGIAVIVMATAHFRRNRRRIEQDALLPTSPLPLGLAIILGLLGVLVFIYLIRVA